MAADIGNRLFTEKKYTEAIESYTSALSKNPKDYRSMTNRALCYIKLNEWSSVIEDSQTIIGHDPSSIKAHFYLGQAYMATDDYDKAIDSLQTANTLAKEQRRNFGDDITGAIRLAKKKRWQEMEERRLNNQSELHSLLEDLLKQHKESKLKEIQSLPDGELSEQSVLINEKYIEQVTELKQIFQDADSTKKERDVPDYLCGKISFELMKDPCITPSGITYDREDIEEHLNRVGHFDPITRSKLTSDQLIPNLAMKEVIDAFVSENGHWIDEY